MVTWSGSRGAETKVYLRPYDSDANPLSGETVVNTGNGGRPSIAVDGAGVYTVVWGFGDIFGRRFDSDGSG